MLVVVWGGAYPGPFDPQAVWTIPIEDKTSASCDFSYILVSTFYIFLPEWIHLYMIGILYSLKFHASGL